MTLRYRSDNGWRAIRWCVGAAAAAAALATPALAHDSILSSTTGTWERGVVNAFGTQSQPWVRKYFGFAGQCIRFEVQNAVPFVDLEMVVVAPNVSTRYRNDDSGALTCTVCPLVTIDPAPTTGYYTVVVSHWNGAPVNTDFILDYRRLPAGDAACAAPTTPFGVIRAGKTAPATDADPGATAEDAE